MITVALTATIDATDRTVWRALLEPDARARWDDRILGSIALPPTSERLLPGRHRARPGRLAGIEALAPRSDAAPIGRACWRFRLSGIPLVMVEEIHRIEGRERLLGSISIGSMHFDQTITVHAEDDGSGPRTRLGLKLLAGNSIAVFGERIPRLEVQRFVIEYVDTTLRQLRKYCEARPGPELAADARECFAAPRPTATAPGPNR